MHKLCALLAHLSGQHAPNHRHRRVNLRTLPGTYAFMPSLQHAVAVMC